MNMDEQTKQKPVEDVCPSKKGKLSLEDVQAKLEQTSGPQYWRSLEELAGAPEFHVPGCHFPVRAHPANDFNF